MYWLSVAVLLILSARLNDGHLIYPLDDSYIHMAMAKNAALHHIWGVTKYGFSSSTSSPVWTFLLTLVYLLFGVNEAAPLLLSLVCGTLVLVASYLFLARYIANRGRIFILLLAAVFATPLPSLTISGMEHVLHALVSLCLLFISIRAISSTGRLFERYFVLLMILAPLVTVIRYEGIFLAFLICLFLLLQRRYGHAVALGITALLPVTIYGIWSMAHGWYFLPNSVFLKGHLAHSSLKEIIRLFGYDLLYSIQAAPHILVLLVISLLFLSIGYSKRTLICEELKDANLIFIGCLLLHMQFAATGCFFRYEAYLVLLGVVIMGATANQLWPEYRWNFSKETLPRYATAMIAILLAASPLCMRASRSLSITAQATNNVYEQQYQMAAFVKKYYPDAAVALNDIGAISYFTDARIVDLWGLASLKIAKLKLQKNYQTKQIDDLAREQNVDLAIIYDDWLNEAGGSPQQWVNEGRWRIPNNVVCGADTVSIFAVNPSAGAALKQNLKCFGSELPADVWQNGDYTAH